MQRVLINTAGAVQGWWCLCAEGTDEHGRGGNKVGGACVQRVLINTAGDMIVRPSFIEAAVQRNSTSSLQQHLLVSYQRAHVAIIKAQFTKKRLRDGASVCPTCYHIIHRPKSAPNQDKLEGCCAATQLCRIVLHTPTCKSAMLLHHARQTLLHDVLCQCKGSSRHRLEQRYVLSEAPLLRSSTPCMFGCQIQRFVFPKISTWF